MSNGRNDPYNLTSGEWTDAMVELRGVKTAVIDIKKDFEDVRHEIRQARKSVRANTITTIIAFLGIIGTVLAVVLTK